MIPTRAGLVVFDAYLGVLYRWVSDEDGRFPLEENLMVTLDLVLAGIAREPSVEHTRNSQPRSRTGR